MYILNLEATWLIVQVIHCNYIIYFYYGMFIIFVFIICLLYLLHIQCNKMHIHGTKA